MASTDPSNVASTSTNQDITTTTESPPYTLVTYFRSSCSARLRIALALKSLPYTPVYINLLAGEQHSPANLSFNPSHSVPTLIPKPPPPSHNEPPTPEFTITQSLSALLYLDETHPSTPPLFPPPSNPTARATAHTLALIIACDVQPVTNLRILQRLETLLPPTATAAEKAAARARWARDLIADGLAAYEALAARHAGIYSMGDTVSVADVCLVPAVWGAERFEVDMRPYPTVVRVCANMAGLEAVKSAHWKSQGDTPVGLRW